MFLWVLLWLLVCSPIGLLLAGFLYGPYYYHPAIGTHGNMLKVIRWNCIAMGIVLGLLIVVPILFFYTDNADTVKKARWKSVF